MLIGRGTDIVRITIMLWAPWTGATVGLTPSVPAPPTWGPAGPGGVGPSDAGAGAGTGCGGPSPAWPADRPSAVAAVTSAFRLDVDVACAATRHHYVAAGSPPAVVCEGMGAGRVRHRRWPASMPAPGPV